MVSATLIYKPSPAFDAIDIIKIIIKTVTLMIHFEECVFLGPFINGHSAEFGSWARTISGTPAEMFGLTA